MIKFFSRVADVFYWLCCFLCVFFVFITIEGIFDGGDNHWIGLMVSVFVYAVGWSIRYMVTGDKGHLFVRMYKKHIKK